MRYIVTLLLSVLTLTGCLQTDLEYNTQLILSPYTQLENGGEYTPLGGCVAYAFEPVDLEEWYIASYADALAGRLRSVATGEYLEAFATSESYAAEGIASSAIAMPIAREEALLLVVDTQKEGYAYALQEFGINLPQTYITVSFLEWKGGTYSAGDWVYNTPELATQIE